jgi:integrase
MFVYSSLVSNICYLVAQYFKGLKKGDKRRIGKRIKQLMPAIAKLRLAELSKSKYRADFNILKDAGEAGGFDPWNVTEEDMCFSLVFFVASRSVHSMAGFISAISSVYEGAGLDLPVGRRFHGFKAGIQRLFGSVDVVSKAYSLSREEVTKVLSRLSNNFQDTVFAVWVLASFFGALRPQDVSGHRLRWSDISWLPGGVEILVRPKKGRMMHGPYLMAAPSLERGSVLDLPRRLIRLWKLLPPGRPLDMSVLADRVFPYAPLKSAEFVKRLRLIYSECFGGLPKGSPITAYSLRRGMATELFEKQIPEATISKVLRHKNPDSTRGYIANLETEVRRWQLAMKAASSK